ncbi:hypothetical protein MTYM_01911 [Methylococcales bacterium]|nr:hypothetical protein MTYM_01911 [Methylococcales bacterium]
MYAQWEWNVDVKKLNNTVLLFLYFIYVRSY